MWFSECSGLAKRASTWADCWDVGVFWRLRFLSGRLERWSWEVGMDSGMGSDMVVFDFGCDLFGGSGEIVFLCRASCMRF